MAEDWVARSRREATAMLVEAHVMVTPDNYDALVDLIALAFRQGALAGLTRAQEIIGTVTP